VDNQIVQFRILREKGKWYMSEKSRAHTHDVKSIAISSTSNLVISGGVDTNLITYSSEKFPKVAREVNSYPQRPMITLSRESKLLCCQFPQKIEIWSLGSGYTPENLGEMASGTNLTLSKKEEKVLELNSKAGGNIICSSISNDGKWLALSNSNEFKLFCLNLQEGKMKVVKVPQATKLVKAAHGIAFTPNSGHLLVVGQDFTLTVLALGLQGNFQIAGAIPLKSDTAAISPSESLRTMVVSADGKYAAFGDTQNRIQIIDLKALKVQYFLLQFLCDFFLLFSRCCVLRSLSL
jgi:WD40 repeat protein